MNKQIHITHTWCFYTPQIADDSLELSPEESAHCVRTLRHQEGDLIHLVNGKGEKYKATIAKAHPKKCLVDNLRLIASQPAPSPIIHLAIAPTKNLDRIEWMIEKLCELGISKVTFILCAHSERKVLKLERLQRKAISALKQSGNLWQMEISPLIKLSDFLSDLPESSSRHIAVVQPDLPHLIKSVDQSSKEQIILIGPEGDFSDKEIKQAEATGFLRVSLGQGTLRTETAGLVACHTAQLAEVIG
ncbi:MAG: RsmE family RNA methyltransferase [Bacteroidota bacterium]